MDQYTCLNCGYVFDEEKGSPNQRMAPNLNTLKVTGCGWHKNQDKAPDVVGVEPGTKWEDVPPEYTCPSCGSSKDMFE